MITTGRPAPPAPKPLEQVGGARGLTYSTIPPAALVVIRTFRRNSARPVC